MAHGRARTPTPDDGWNAESTNFEDDSPSSPSARASRRLHYDQQRSNLSASLIEQEIPSPGRDRTQSPNPVGRSSRGRGRPRKSLTGDPNEVFGQQNPIGGKHLFVEGEGGELPIEERSYRDSFPDLDVLVLLRLLRFPRSIRDERAMREDEVPNLAYGSIMDESTAPRSALVGKCDAVPKEARNRIGEAEEMMENHAERQPGYTGVEDAFVGNDEGEVSGPPTGGNAEPISSAALLTEGGNPESLTTEIPTSDVDLDPYDGVSMQDMLPPIPYVPSKPLPRPVYRPLVELKGSIPGQAEHKMGAAYIRHTEPSEDELAERVEYDMDEQDLCWLNSVNDERRKANLPLCDESFFEKVMDRLEKEWFDLTKDVQKPRDDVAFPEDIACAVCDDGECENSNAIVFCDGCNLAVHQDCYGVPYIPEGQWLCRKCMLSPETPVSCIFCPNEGGAFKKTNTGKWAHLLCAMWIPECALGNPVFMEPIESVEKIPKSRWKLKEYREIHDVEASLAAVQKEAPKKPRNLIVRARSQEASESEDEYEPSENDDSSVSSIALPPKYRRMSSRVISDSDNEVSDRVEERSLSRKQKRSHRDRDLGPGEERDIREASGDSGSKAARAHQHQYAPSAPVVPAYIYDRVVEVLSPDQNDKRKKKEKADFERKLDFIVLVCKYWSLKREARRGAPLLKRLHLEPWTASASANKEDEEMKANRYQTLTYVRGDLERVRLLAELVRKREKEKLRQYQVQQEYLFAVFSPVCYFAKPILEKMKILDRDRFFHDPVSVELAPDYFNFITSPMDFSKMAQKLESQEYRKIDEVAADFELIWSNCMLYNKPETDYYKCAVRMQKRCELLMEELRDKLAKLPIHKESGVMQLEPSPLIYSYGLPDGWREKTPPPPSLPPLSVDPMPAAEVDVTQGGNSEKADVEAALVAAMEQGDMRITRNRAAKITQMEEEAARLEKEAAAAARRNRRGRKKTDTVETPQRGEGRVTRRTADLQLLETPLRKKQDVDTPVSLPGNVAPKTNSHKKKNVPQTNVKGTPSKASERRKSGADSGPKLQKGWVYVPEEDDPSDTRAQDERNLDVDNNEGMVLRTRGQRQQFGLLTKQPVDAGEVSSTPPRKGLRKSSSGSSSRDAHPAAGIQTESPVDKPSEPSSISGSLAFNGPRSVKRRRGTEDDTEGVGEGVDGARRRLRTSKQDDDIALPGGVQKRPERHRRGSSTPATTNISPLAAKPRSTRGPNPATQTQPQTPLGVSSSRRPRSSSLVRRFSESEPRSGRGSAMFGAILPELVQRDLEDDPQMMGLLADAQAAASGAHRSGTPPAVTIGGSGESQSEQEGRSEIAPAEDSMLPTEPTE
ncbi:nuA3 HAT complex component nto1 [Borealophlyctis nickersoniae]|nr:nuA3 HAT complex component nto1 [Borealophlyctis nickersoniae]